MRLQIAAFAPALVASGLLLTPALAQSTQPAQPFGEAISITEVEVPVRVLHRGEPVRGLTADDFEVFDDGEPADVIGFRVVDTEAALGDGGATTAGGAETAEPRNVLYLFDLLLTTSQRLERGLHGGREQLVGQLGPNDRVAVGYLSRRGARLLLGFTGNREEIDRAFDLVQALLDGRSAEIAAGMRWLARAQGLDHHAMPDMEEVTWEVAGAGNRQATRIGSLSERFGRAVAVSVVGGVAALPADGWGATVGGLPRPVAGVGDGDGPLDDVASRIINLDPFALGQDVVAAEEASLFRAQTEQISEIVTLLRGIRGQKHVLLLTQGVSSSQIQRLDAPLRPLILRYLQRMFESLRRASWTLHVVDAEGIESPFAGGEGEEDDSGASNAHALFTMANGTGGHLFANYNRLPDATERLLTKTGVTYVLTIRPPADLPANGRFRRLKVRMGDEPWLTRIHHRTGYYAPKPAGERSPLERKLDTIDLLLGEAEIDELPASIEVETGGAAGGRVPVSFRVSVPGEVFRADSGPNTVVQVQVYAVDPNGGVQDLWMRRIALDLERVGARLSAAGLTVAGDLSLPPGEYRLRSLVRHPGSDRLTLTTTELAIRGVTE